MTHFTESIRTDEEPRMSTYCWPYVQNVHLPLWTFCDPGHSMRIQNLVKRRALDLAVKLASGSSFLSHSGPGFESWLPTPSSFLPTCALGGRRWWDTFLVLCYPSSRLRLNSWLQAPARLSLNLCGLLSRNTISAFSFVT